MDSSLKSIGLKAATALCVYLVFSLSTASAVEISIYNHIVGTEEPLKFDLDYNDIIDKKFDIVIDESDTKYENVQVKISVMGKNSTYRIKRVLLFKCKDTNPHECVGYDPVEAVDMLSGEKGTFYWKDVSRNSEANFLTFVKFTNEEYGVDSWIAYWDYAKRTSVRDFTKKSREISSADIYAAEGKEPEWIKEFMLRHYMIPANWADKTVVGPVDGSTTEEMYLLLANSEDMETTFFYPSMPDGDTISTITRDYMFAFPAGNIPSPLTFFSNPAPECGDGQCDAGENTELCCLDCGCDNGETCTASDAKPNGLCHACGDGYLDPVENSTNCCADAGCTGTDYCDTSENPDGFCVTPLCPNGECEPTENSGTCAPDCWETPGKTCADVFGSGYYYEAQECIQAVCPNDKCEVAGGENTQNCCADCESLQACPSGEYCDKESVPAGVCTAPTCGERDCEAEEDSSNCCTDCGCDGDLECEDNVCHLCGNGVYEKPVETEDNCCADTNCPSGEYCTLENSCMEESGIGFTAKMLPSDINCENQDSTVEVKFTPKNAPMDMEYEKVTYIYDNSMYTLENCEKVGDIYTCDFPINGSSSFRGCYGDPGTRPVTFTISMMYYEDAEAKSSGHAKYKDVSIPLDINVVKTRKWACNEDGTCSSGLGENSASCCYDCGCDSGKICTQGGCKSEEEISLTAYSIPERTDIDCENDVNGDFTFTALVNNVPEKSDDPFRIVGAAMEYKDEMYTTDEMGFSCDPLTNEEGMHTGFVDCTVPIAYFPACRDATEQANMWLHLNVLGGGLSATHPHIGLPLKSDLMLFRYIHGLPLCGNGQPDPGYGETDQNCCQDVECTDPDSVCTYDGSCRPLSDMGLDVEIDPAINCILESEADTENRMVKIEATMKDGIRPYTRGGSVRMGSVYIDGIRLEEMRGTRTSDNDDGNGWEFEIPVAEFVPYCYENGLHGSSPDAIYDPAVFQTELTWQDKDGANVGLDVEEGMTFNIEARNPECNGINGCQRRLGETSDTCCWDCGCTGGRICTSDMVNECVEPDQVDLTVEASPSTLNCQSLADDDKLTLDVSFDNHPHDVDSTVWMIEYKDGEDSSWETLNRAHFDCSAGVDFFGDETGDYTCEIPLYYFPPCTSTSAENPGKQVRVTARMLYTDVTSPNSRITLKPSDTTEVTVDTAGTPLCGNGACDAGETKGNCCTDCGCPSVAGNVCTEAGYCVAGCDGDGECGLELNVESSKSPAVSCQMTPGKIEDFAILDYGCVFQDPLEIELSLDPLPANAVVRSVTYKWERETYDLATNDYKEKSGIYSNAYAEPVAGGWKLNVMLNPDATYKVRDDDTKTTKIKDITFTIESRTTAGETQVIKVTSPDVVEARVTAKKNDNLLEYEKVLNDMADAMDKANKLVCNVVSVLATCAICSIMAPSSDQEVEQMPSIQDRINNIKEDLGNLGEKIGKRNTASMEDLLFELEEGLPPADEITKPVIIKGTSAPGYINIQPEGGEQIYDYEDSNQNNRLDPTNPMAAVAVTGMQIATGGGTNLGTSRNSLGIFTELTTIISDGKAGSSVLGGLVAGALFIGLTNSMLDCSQGYVNYLIGAVGVCTLLVYASPQTLRSISRLCDQLVTALQLVKLVVSLQRSTIEYNTCMVSAEAEMAKGQSDSENGYDLALRTSNYYAKTSSCTETSTTRMTGIVEDLSEASYDMGSNIGNAQRGVTIRQPTGTKVGPGGESSTIDIEYYFPPSSGSSTSGYGTIVINANYKYTNAAGTSTITGYPSKTANIKLMRNTGSIRCDVDSNGMQCTDLTGGTGTRDLYASCSKPDCTEHKVLSGGTIVISYTGGTGSATYPFVPLTSSNQQPSQQEPSGNDNVDCGSKHTCTSCLEYSGECVYSPFDSACVKRADMGDQALGFVTQASDCEKYYSCLGKTSCAVCLADDGCAYDTKTQKCVIDQGMTYSGPPEILRYYCTCGDITSCGDCLGFEAESCRYIMFNGDPEDSSNYCVGISDFTSELAKHSGESVAGVVSSAGCSG